MSAVIHFWDSFIVSNCGDSPIYRIKNGTIKLIAISECGSVPDIDSSFRDNSVWSFFGIWYGKYIADENGKYSEDFTSRDTLARTYNSDGALTLDEYKEMTKEG